MIVSFVERYGLTADKAAEHAREIGITKDNIVDRFNELFEHIGTRAKQKRTQPMPDLAGEPEGQPVEEPVAPAPQPEPAASVSKPELVAPEPEPVVFDNWKAIDAWLKGNQVDVADAIIKVKEKFGDFVSVDCPKYQKFLANEYKL